MECRLPNFRENLPIPKIRRSYEQHGITTRSDTSSGLMPRQLTLRYLERDSFVLLFDLAQWRSQPLLKGGEGQGFGGRGQFLFDKN